MSVEREREVLIEVLDRYTQKLESICDRICRIRRVSTVVSLGLVAIAVRSIDYPVVVIVLLVAVFFVERGAQQELGVFYKWGAAFYSKLEEAVRCGSQIHEHFEKDKGEKRRLDAHLTSAEFALEYFRTVRSRRVE